MCAQHLHTRTQLHMHAWVGAQGNTQVAAAAGCSRVGQKLQSVLAVDIRKQFNLPSAFHKE